MVVTIAGVKNPLPLETHDFPQFSKFIKNLFKIYILAVFKIAKKNYTKMQKMCRHIRIC